MLPSAYVCMDSKEAVVYSAVFPLLPPVALFTDGMNQKIIKIKKIPTLSAKRGVDLALPHSLQKNTHPFS